MQSDDGSDRTSNEPSSRMLVALSLVALVGLTAGPLAAPASAHAGADAVTIEASEDCPDRTYCYEVTSGSLEEVSGGDTLEITFKNPSSNSLNHNLHIARLSDANVGEDTAAEDAYASTEDLEPGNQTTLEAQVPSGADGIYLWCDVGVHEGQGMYKEVHTGSEDGGSSDGTDDDQNSSPGLGAAAALVAFAGVALALTRR